MKRIAVTLLALALGGWATDTAWAARPTDTATVGRATVATPVQWRGGYRSYYGAPYQNRMYRDYAPYNGPYSGYRYGYRYNYPRYYYRDYDYPNYRAPNGNYGYYGPGTVFRFGY